MTGDNQSTKTTKTRLIVKIVVGFSLAPSSSLANYSCLTTPLRPHPTLSHYTTMPATNGTVNPSPLAAAEYEMRSAVASLHHLIQPIAEKLGKQYLSLISHHQRKAVAFDNLKKADTVPRSVRFDFKLTARPAVAEHPSFAAISAMADNHVQEVRTALKACIVSTAELDLLLVKAAIARLAVEIAAIISDSVLYFAVSPAKAKAVAFRLARYCLDHPQLSHIVSQGFETPELIDTEIGKHVSDPARTAGDGDDNADDLPFGFDVNAVRTFLVRALHDSVVAFDRAVRDIRVAKEYRARVSLREKVAAVHRAAAVAVSAEPTTAPAAVGSVI